MKLHLHKRGVQPRRKKIKNPTTPQHVLDERRHKASQLARKRPQEPSPFAGAAVALGLADALWGGANDHR